MATTVNRSGTANKSRVRKHRRRTTILIVLGSLLVLLIGLRIALPYILLRVVNRELTQIEGYSGHVDDIDVALIRGAYTLKNTKLDKVGGKVPVPFFSAPVIDLSLEWGALFHGAIDGKIRAEHPILNFVKGPSEATSQTKIDSSWVDVVKKLMPLKINRLEINEGEIHYRDFYSNPKVDIFTKRVHILAENLSNAKHNKEIMPSTAEASAQVYGGQATLHMKLNVLSKIPVFEAKAELVSLDITNLNDFLQAYAKLDVKSGHISIYMEAATKDNVVRGYTKPIIKDLKVVNWEKDKDHPLKLAWEAVVGSVAWVFKNHGKDQLATKVEFEGSLKSPHIRFCTMHSYRRCIHRWRIRSISTPWTSGRINRIKSRSRFLERSFTRIKRIKRKKKTIKRRSKADYFLAAPFFFGTLAPSFLASERPMAMACLRLVTFLPLRPLFKVPDFFSFMARSTFLPASLEYLAIV
jgi:hypothetical protein